MFDTFTKVEIAGEEHPIKCNIEVLAALQEHFGTLNAFEMSILGLKEITDENGKPKKDEKGNILFQTGEPSFRTIMFALPVMLKAGYDDAIEQGDVEERPDLRKAIKEADFDHIETASAIHDEFKRCYARKNRRAPQKRGKKEMETRSTSGES